MRLAVDPDLGVVAAAIDDQGRIVATEAAVVRDGLDSVLEGVGLFDPLD
ncbi:hypothetical protein [Nocardioides stalactiti]|nr:hypothetical protein [Nocardioides stalactiti]